MKKNVGRLLLLTYINDLHETLCDSAFHLADCMENVILQDRPLRDAYPQRFPSGQCGAVEHVYAYLQVSQY